MALRDWEEFDVKTVVENYEDLAKEIEPLTGAKDNHFDTIMNFIKEYKEIKKLDCDHYFVTFGDQKIRRCAECDRLEK